MRNLRGTDFNIHSGSHALVELKLSTVFIVNSKTAICSKQYLLNCTTNEESMQKVNGFSFIDALCLALALISFLRSISDLFLGDL